jgi:hypothetical protein
MVPHQHTSYPALLFLLLLAIILLAAVSFGASADDYVIPGPQSDSATVTGTVTSPAPQTPPTLEGLSNGQTITDAPVPVRGSCPANSLVKVFKNEILAGTAICGKDKRYNLDIDLFIGENRLVARAYNTLEKSSPDSNVITVSYAPKTAAGLAVVSAPVYRPGDSLAGQFFLKAENFHKGVRPGDQIVWPLTIVGGTPPYAVSVSWGDNKTDVYSRGVAGPFDIKHVYSKSGGGYRGSQDVVVKASDANGLTTYIQLVSIVNDTNSIVAAAQSLPTKLQLAWPLLGMAVLMVASFFLGEWREKKVLKRRMA